MHSLWMSKSYKVLIIISLSNQQTWNYILYYIVEDSLKYKVELNVCNCSVY